jgi:hypothetical protein
MKNILSGKAVALFMASLMAVAFSGCGKVEDTDDQNSIAESTVSETVTEESSDIESSSETAVESTADSSVPESAVTTESTSEAEESEDSAPEEITEKITDDRYLPYIQGLVETIRAGERDYYGPDNTDSESVRVDLELCHNAFNYTFTDIDNNGDYELFIGFDHTNNEGITTYECIGFVVITPNGEFKNLASSWTRSSTEYVGDLYFHSDGSGGASLHISSIYRYDPSTQSLAVEANLITEYEGTDSDGLPIPVYSLYEGRKAEHEVGAKDDPNALHGDEAQNKWNEYMEKAYSYNDTLGKAQWTKVYTDA